MAGNVDILFRAELDATGAIQGLKRLDQEAQQSARGLGNFGNQAGGLSSKLGGLSTALQGAWAAFTGSAAAMAAYNFLKSSVDAAIEAEQAHRKLEAVLKATGFAAGLTADQISDYASRMQYLTGVDDDTIKSAAAVLATFRNVREDAFERTMTAALDLSAVFGQDLQSSVTMLGKALEDPIQGMTALRRVGVSFSEAEQQVIKDLVEHNRLAEAQARILAVVEAQVGRTAMELGQTLGGQLNILKGAFSDFQEAVGGGAGKVGALSDALWLAGQGLKELTAALEDTNKALGGSGGAEGLLHLLPGGIGAFADYVAELRKTNAEQERLVDNTRKIIAAWKTQSSEHKQVIALSEGEQKALEKLRDSLDPIRKATGQYNEAMALLKKALDAGNISQAEFNKAAAAALEQLDKVKLASNKTAKELADLAERFKDVELASYRAIKPDPWAEVATAAGFAIVQLTHYGNVLFEVERQQKAPNTAEWRRAWDEIGRDFRRAMAGGLTDGILGTLAGDQFRDAFSNVWRNLWQVSARQLDEMLLEMLQGGSFADALEKGGLIQRITMPDESELAIVNWYGVGSMAGGLLMGYGAQKGNRWASAAGGALSGASMMPGAYAWVGAIVGAIAGYILGGTGSGMKDFNLDYRGSMPNAYPRLSLEDVGGAEEQEMARQFMDTYKRYRGEYRDVLKQLGMPSKPGDWAMFNFVQHGSTKDLNQWWDTILKGELPRQMFEVVSGQFKTGLGGLGVSDSRIAKELAALQEGKFDTAWGKFRDWINALVDITDVSKLMGKSPDEMREEVNRSFRETFLQGFDDVLKKAHELTDGLTGLFSEEQVANAQELLSVARDQYQASLQYYAQLEQLSQGIRDRFSETFLGFEETKARERGPAELGAFYQRQLDDLMRQLSGADSAEQVDRLTQQILRYGQQLWGLNLGDNEAANYAYRQQVEELLRKAEEESQAKIREWEEEESKRRQALKDELDKMRDGLAGATSGTGDFQQSLNDGGDAVDDFADRLRDGSGEVANFVDALQNATFMLAALTAAGGGPAPTQGRNG